MTSSRITGLVLVGFLASLVSSSHAQPITADPITAVCPAPISTCRQGPVPLDLSRPDIMPLPACPDGYRCVCVPSCPLCADCAAEVCLAGSDPQCKTACDCEAGLGCFAGRCLAGFAPVYCCGADPCPAGKMCQSRDGTFGRCDRPCTDAMWLCDATTGSAALECAPGRTCQCTASCPLCEDCGPPVCAPDGAPVPYRCSDDGRCANPGDRCVCASSCPDCDDCPLQICVPDRCADGMCEARVRKITRKIGQLVKRAGRCRHSRQCTFVDTSTGCLGTCGAFVRRALRHPVEQVIARWDERICSTFIEDGCPYATPGCIEQHAECIDRQCVGVPGVE